MATSATDLQVIIDAKVALLNTLCQRIADVTANPRPSYSEDGQSFSWESYLRSLTDAQRTETECLVQLYKLQNIATPWVYVSGPGCGGCC